MKFDEYEIKFIVGKYNEDNSTYIGAVVMEDGEPVDYYDDVTICSMHTAFGGEQVVLDVNNSKELIDAMVENGLIEITPYIGIRSGFCDYPKGRLTKKFFDEIAGDKIEAYNTVFANELRGNMEYNGYYIEYNFYKRGEYTVHYMGNDFWFETVEEAKEFIDEIRVL